jgi:hypothetical protein
VQASPIQPIKLTEFRKDHTFYAPLLPLGPPTTSWRRVLHAKLIVTQIVKKFPALY